MLEFQFKIYLVDRQCPARRSIKSTTDSEVVNNYSEIESGGQMGIFWQ